ncbi:MAG: TMEM175 family protein [Terracidiphilus sp.]
MTRDTSRIEAFSDGVFSIAATLLVLELKAPAAGLTFWQGIWQQWPGYASFLLSFLFIGIMWINHHRLFSHIQHSDDALMAANLLLLLGVVWIPYPTLLLARALDTENFRDAAILYNASYVALALLFNLLLFTCIKRGLVDRNYAEVRGIAWRFASGPALYVLSLIATFWNVPLSLAVNAGLALFYLVSPDESAKAHAARHQ